MYVHAYKGIVSKGGSEHKIDIAAIHQEYSSQRPLGQMCDTLSNVVIAATLAVHDIFVALLYLSLVPFTLILVTWKVHC